MQQTGVGVILPLQKDQVNHLYSQAYISNIAMLAAALVSMFAFFYHDELTHLGWFSLVVILTIGTRLYLTFRFHKQNKINHKKYIQLYVFASLALGLAWGFFSLVYFEIQNIDLRIFLTIVNLGLITAAVGSLSFWMPAYLSFSLPQIISLLLMFTINENVFVGLAVLVFSVFMILIAKNSNDKFKEGRRLLQDNKLLIKKMDDEIKHRGVVQSELEQYKEELQELVEERTSELLVTNEDLKEQIKKRAEVEQDLENLAYYDVLTSLPNRSLLIERLKRAISVARRNQTLFSVLFIDLDRFKTINDSLGHTFGDKLLQQVAIRLENLLRDSDTIARNGGDEFVILIESMKDVREAFVVAEKVIQSMADNFLIEGHEVHIGTSIGISVYPIDGDDALDLLKMSDTAMYCAKETGTNRFEFYSSTMSSQIKDRLELETSLRSALINNEFYLVYQPQVDVNSRQTVGLEALLRWENKTLGKVSPVKFIPVLEETGLIYEVGEWIILQALAFIKSGGSNGAKVSINLSALQCGVNRFSETIKKYIEQSGVSPNLIEFEVTESILINDFKKTERFLKNISELGCTIALDDFGTGYTSFGYLTKLPIDIIKIDRSLISNIDQQQNLQDIVRAIVTMSRSLGIENIFEGVETEAELNVVRELSGHVIQGYFYSQPLEAEKLSGWFQSK